MKTSASVGRTLSWIAALASCACWIPLGAVAAESLPVSAFSAPPRISDVQISPDGRYLALITSIKKAQTLVIQDRTVSGAAGLHAVLGASEGFRLLWCRWASDARILCGMHAPTTDANGKVVSKTRVIGADADGKNVKVLVEYEDAPGITLLSRVLAWDIPGRPNIVLMLGHKEAGGSEQWSGTRATGDTNTRQTVFALDAMTGELKQDLPPHEPLTSFLVDAKGEPALGWGTVPGGDTEYDVRDPETHGWRKVGTFAGNLTPIALCPAALNCAYALGDSDGYKALWRIDLSGKDKPVVEYARPAADLDNPMLAQDGHLFGVRYDAAEPMAYYADPTAAGIIDTLKKLLPGQFIQIDSYTRDGHQMIVKASSDTDVGSFYLYDMEKNTLARVGAGYPDLVADRIGEPRPVSFPAKDGTSVPAFVTLPPGGSGKDLPLVALPHGGQSEHDSRSFNLLRAFLVSRGYAVLQVNYRGSSGLGSKWLADSHGDWSGLPYSDVTDGVRWAIAQGIADAKRVAIIGSDYAGYLALEGAQRNPDLFRCAVSIGGYSDFGLQLPGAAPMMFGFGGGKSPADMEKLRNESPHMHAADFKVPVLLVHGERDTVVTVEQSKAMDTTLTAAHKPHQLLLLPSADHTISMEDDRTKEFTALETFLATNLH